MGKVYIFRGKSATGKSTISNMLAEKLSITVIRIDDIIDALKTTPDIDKNLVNNMVCYNVLCKIIQTNLDLGVDFIVDIGLGDRKNAQWFYNRLNFHNNNVFRFMTVCNDEKEWERRHIERIKNPLPHQSFKSFEHVLEHYLNFDNSLLAGEFIIDSTGSLDDCFSNVLRYISSRKV